MNEAGVVYIIQINMADPGQERNWDNMGAYEDLEQAEAQVEWLKGEYGDEIEYRIDIINFYPAKEQA